MITLGLGGCGYNRIQGEDEQIKAAWSEVVNQYQRRADLIPNLVNTVKGYAQQEKEVLESVTNARARVGSIQATPELINDPAAFQKFQAAQGEMTSALSRLLVVAENYPQLKSDQNFRDLQAQLEGTENRITVARKRYHRRRAGVQHHGPAVPGESHGDDVRLQREAQLHGGERGRHRQAADGGFQYAEAEAVARVAIFSAAALVDRRTGCDGGVRPRACLRWCCRCRRHRERSRTFPFRPCGSASPT